MELARCDAAIEVDGAVVFGLPASDVQLVALNGDVETVFIEPRHGEADAQPIVRHLHDIVRGIALGRRARQPVDHFFQAIEAEQKGAAER